jgi:class 3 adenylate cyclase
MAVFIGDHKRTHAAKAALRINYAVSEIINPAIAARYADQPFKLRHAVGVDISKLFVARTGIRGSNDLVWIGRAANYAAKLSALREGDYMSIITEDVFRKMNDEVRFSGEGKKPM